MQLCVLLAQKRCIRLTLIPVVTLLITWQMLTVRFNRKPMLLINFCLPPPFARVHALEISDGFRDFGARCKDF